MSLLKKSALLVTLMIAVALTYFYLNPIYLDGDSVVFGTERNPELEAQQEAEYNAFMQEAEQTLAELDAASDRLVEEDKHTDQRLKQRDQELGLTDEAFEAQYPGMNMNGVYFE